ncbi:MAG: hypothetical protein K2Y18_01690 [Alphaproteobacteria bacterium]|jgi:hypothetical protein|nr:hypothetical protein [Alphaproteobacteria bacterium]
MNEEALWKLADEGGLAALTVDRLAQETGQHTLDLKTLYPDPAFMVLVLMEEIHNQAMTTQIESTSAILDRLTDQIMAHLDACLAHRETIRRLWGDLVSTPMVVLTLRPYLMKMVGRVLKECGLKDDDLWSPIRLRAYAALIIYVLYTWLYDETPQQEHTLVTLDRGLKQLSEMPW